MQWIKRLVSQNKYIVSHTWEIELTMAHKFYQSNRVITPTQTYITIRSDGELNWYDFIWPAPWFNVDGVYAIKLNPMSFLLSDIKIKHIDCQSNGANYMKKKKERRLIYLPILIYFRVYFFRNKVQIITHTLPLIFLHLFYYNTNLNITLIKSNKLHMNTIKSK